MSMVYSSIIGVHIVAAVGAVGLGITILSLPKGTPRHKMIGRMWVALMTIVAVGSFWIKGLAGEGFSFIHGLSIFTLVSMIYAIFMIRRGNRRAHFSAMIGCFVGAVIAGLLTLSPDRMIGGFFFGG